MEWNYVLRERVSFYWSHSLCLPFFRQILIIMTCFVLFIIKFRCRSFFFYLFYFFYLFNSWFDPISLFYPSQLHEMMVVAVLFCQFDLNYICGMNFYFSLVVSFYFIFVFTFDLFYLIVDYHTRLFLLFIHLSFYAMCVIIIIWRMGCSLLIRNCLLLPDTVSANCPLDFDGYLCWPETPAGTTAVQHCPDFVTGFVPKLFAHKK